MEHDSRPRGCDVNLVKNTTQRVVGKALGAMENYDEYDDFGQPSHTKDGTYPLRANYEEGYNLTLTEDGDISFRISAKPYKHVKGALYGGNLHLDILKTALTSDDWKIGTAEVLFKNGALSYTSPSPTSNRPFETSWTHERSLA